MAGSAEEIWRNAVDLSAAWEELAIPYDRKLYKELCDAAKHSFLTAELNQLNQTIIEEKANLKNGLLIRIMNGYLDAYGRDITHSTDVEISKLPNSLFNQHARGFEIEWEANRIFVRDRTIIDVRIFPTEPQTPQIVDKATAPKPAHRPNMDKEIKPAIKTLVKKSPDFWSLSRTRQCELVREEIHGPDVNHREPPNGFGDGAIKNRLRDMEPS